MIPLLLYMMMSNLLKDTLFYECCSLVSLPSLLHVFRDVLLLQLPHALNLVQVDHEAGVVAVVQADALAAEDSEVVAAVEVLHSFGMLLAQFFLEGVLVFVGSCSTGLLEVEVGL